MARPKHRLQAIRAEDAHATALRELFANKMIERAYIGVAFARAPGVKLIKNVLTNLGSRVKVFVGIRNEVTSAQALLELHKLGVELYVVDTGRTTEIFHPKIYAAILPNFATILIGSPNLTAGGLEANIEASTALSLDLSDCNDMAYLEDLEEAFEKLRTSYPENVIRITRARQVAEFLRQGRVTDETIRRLPATTAVGGAGAGRRETVPRMQLARRDYVPRPKPERPRKRFTRGRTGFVLVWESDELSERDLNIPRGRNTNPTGSMTLRKGRTTGIDHRHYFRDEVFRGITWTADSARAKRHLEAATAEFNVVIKGVNYGVHNIVLRHDTRKASPSYKQKNAMTHLRWGELRELVARRDLLNSTLRIYRREGSPPIFALEVV